MPYFKNDDVNILFIHIPKTGGTSLDCYFSSKFNIPLNTKSLYGFLDAYGAVLNENMKINVSLQHLLYNQIVKYNKIFNINFDTIKIITIVRNPYERSISDLFWFKFISSDSTKEEVFTRDYDDVIREGANEFVRVFAQSNPQRTYLVNRTAFEIGK